MLFKKVNNANNYSEVVNKMQEIFDNYAPMVKLQLNELHMLLAGADLGGGAGGPVLPPLKKNCLYVKLT